MQNAQVTSVFATLNGVDTSSYDRLKVALSGASPPGEPWQPLPPAPPPASLAAPLPAPKAAPPPPTPPVKAPTRKGSAARRASTARR
jgi:hypothetical protein